jgi:Neuraminidase (sialidase)
MIHLLKNPRKILCFAENYGNPMMFRMVTENGIERLWIFARPWIARILSEDGGKTWKELEPLGLPNVLPFTAIVSKNPEKQDGKYIGLYTWQLDAEGKVMNGEGGPGPMQIIQTETDDAGLTWSKPRVVAAVDGLSLLEGFAFWSPDNKELCCLMRENGHKGRSRMMFSNDNGTTWSTPVETSWGLTGDRHVGIMLPDHRFVFAFRDRAINSPTYGHFVCWVGTYEDIKNNKPGQFRVKLLHSYAGGDCGYPCLHLLPDNTILAITYIKYKQGNDKQSIVGTYFRLTNEGVENLPK